MSKADSTKQREEKSSKLATAEATAVHVGIDLGTNTSVILASHNGKPLDLKQDIVTSVVGGSPASGNAGAVALSARSATAESVVSMGLLVVGLSGSRARPGGRARDGLAVSVA